MAEPAHKEDQQAAPAASQDEAGATNVTELPRRGPQPRRWLRGLIRFVLMLVLPAALLFYGATLWAESLRYVNTENAYVKANLVAISADVEGRVIEINVKNNQTVQRGDVLFRIDPRPYELEVKGALAELDQVRQDIRTMRVEYGAGQKEVEELQERVAYLQREHERAQQLTRRGVSTTQRLDEAQTELQMAVRQVSTQQEKNRMVLAELGGSLQRGYEEHPKYQKALADLDAAQLDLERTTVLAPAAGIVSNVTLRLGEYVNAGTPVFSLVETSETWIEANLKETQLTHVTVGQQATLVADAYPDVTYRARIESISPATGAEFALLPPQNASGNWVKVVQRVPVRMVLEEGQDLPELRAGMTITVNIDTERQRTLKQVVYELLDSSGVAGYLPAAVTSWLMARPA